MTVLDDVFAALRTFDEQTRAVFCHEDDRARLQDALSITGVAGLWEVRSDVHVPRGQMIVCAKNGPMEWSKRFSPARTASVRIDP